MPSMTLGQLGRWSFSSQWPNRAGPCLHETTDRVQFTERMSALYDLVFELRQEVVDLQYRTQATKEKVASFLQIISSMHEALFSDLVDTSPKENSEADKEETQDKMQNPTESGREREERKDDIKEPAWKEEAGEQWDYGVTYIEEEPWPGDLPATWPTYQPGV
jgi:TATA-binding protein-associated factor Taf7